MRGGSPPPCQSTIAGASFGNSGLSLGSIAAYGAPGSGGSVDTRGGSFLFFFRGWFFFYSFFLRLHFCDKCYFWGGGFVCQSLFLRVGFQ